MPQPSTADQGEAASGTIMAVFGECRSCLTTMAMGPASASTIHSPSRIIRQFSLTLIPAVYPACLLRGAGIRMTEMALFAERPGKFSIFVAPAAGMIECDMHGLWSLDDGAYFCGVLENRLSLHRREHGYAKVLFDMSSARLQIFTAMTLPRSTTMIREGDQVAIVVTSALLRLHLQQPHLTSQHAWFRDRSEAQTWLMLG